jgi:hypothetical protein
MDTGVSKNKMLILSKCLAENNVGEEVLEDVGSNLFSNVISHYKKGQKMYVITIYLTLVLW